MADIIVSKYGGSSITSFEDIERIHKITKADPNRRVIVVSAPGKRNKDDTKVTDMLIQLAKTQDHKLIDKICERYMILFPKEDVKELSMILEERYRQDKDKDSYLDSLKAFGEEACARMIAKCLDYVYVDPKDIFQVSEDYANAKIHPVSEEMIEETFKEAKTYVVPGFYGYTKNGSIATFSRGGSDLTAGYIAASLDAKVYENFTDTEGIYVANPDIVKEPKKIVEVTFDEMQDLAYSGFNIFHDEAIYPVRKKRISVHIRGTFHYPKEGTYIVDNRRTDSDRPIVGVAYKSGFCSFDAEKFGLNSEVGICRKLLQIFEEDKISIEYITTGIDDMSFILREDQLKESPSGIEEIEKRLYSVLGDDSSINFQERLGSLVVSGKGLIGKKGISAEIQMTLAKAGINIRFISQGPLERCIIYGIDDSDKDKAVNAIYDKYLK